jgi:uncharacterized membrane protein
LLLKYFEVFILAATPIIELRGALPVAILGFHLSIWQSYFLCVVGSFTPTVVIVYLLGPVSDFLRKYIKFFEWFFTKLFHYARGKHSQKIEALKEGSVFVIAALPIPLAGAWSAALVAFVFDIPPKKSLPLMLLGTVVAGAIVLLLTLGAKAIF